MNKLISKRFLVLTATGLLIIGCSSNTSKDTEVESYKQVAKTSPSGKYVRPLKDGAPWWDVDVSAIPDATPIVHTGSYKNSPYKVFGKPYYPLPSSKNYREVGEASWYGTKFHGQATANGEVYDLYGMTAAHKTLPLPSYVKVTNLENGRSVILRVNDRGPFYSTRIIDLSFAAAKKLGYVDKGTAKVRVEAIDPNQWWASRGQVAPTSEQQAQAQLTQTKKVLHTEKLQQTTTMGVIVTEPVMNDKQPVVAALDPKKKDIPQPAGLYLQVAALSSQNAAESLKDRLTTVTSRPVFISPLAQGNQTLYRVRLGPIPNQNEADLTQHKIRGANLGQATLVKLD